MLPPTGQQVRKLIADGLIIKMPPRVHSRFRARRHAEAVAKGRHCGYGALGAARKKLQGCWGAGAEERVE